MDDNNGTIKLALGIVIGLAVGYIIFKAVNEITEKQAAATASLQDLNNNLNEIKLGLYGLEYRQIQPLEQPIISAQPTSSYKQPIISAQPTSSYNNAEGYEAVRDEKGFLLSLKVKRDAKVR
jgi:hypothetical protein